MATRQPTDWHKADIKAALEKAGWTLARIARAYGYTTTKTPADVLRKPYPSMERIVADIIGVSPSTIWPSRYDADGLPLGPRARLRAIEHGGTMPVSREQSSGTDRNAA